MEFEWKQVVVELEAVLCITDSGGHCDEKSGAARVQGQKRPRLPAARSSWLIRMA